MKELLALSINNEQIPVPKSIPQPDTGMAAKVIGNGLDIFIIAGIAISVAMIAWAGIQWAYSGGDKQRVAAARAKLTWAIIGVVIMLLAFGIINLFSFLFGVNLLNLNFST
jgi:hypothetical protein